MKIKVLLFSVVAFLLSGAACSAATLEERVKALEDQVAKIMALVSAVEEEGGDETAGDTTRGGPGPSENSALDDEVGAIDYGPSVDVE